MGRWDWGFGTTYSFSTSWPELSTGAELGGRGSGHQFEVPLHRQAAQVASDSLPPHTGQTDRRAERAACYLAQTRLRELTIESLFFVSSQYFFLKNKYKKKKKKKLITVCFNSQTWTIFVTLFTKTYITEAALIRATSRVRAKGPTKARRDTPLGVTVFATESLVTTRRTS